MSETAWVRKLQQELWDSEPEQPRGQSSGPGNPWISLVGRIQLATDERGRAVYSRLLWPRVRQRLGSPGQYLLGSWAIERIRTADLLLDSVGSPALAQAWSGSIRAPEPRQPDGQPETAQARAEVHRLLRSRLEAGYTLAGIQALWPSRADILARTLWLDAGLGLWDEVVAEALEALKEVVGVFFAGTPLPSELFGPVSTLGTAPDEAHGTPAWRFLLAEDLAARQLPEAVLAGTVEVFERDGEMIVGCGGSEWTVREGPHDEFGAEHAGLIPAGLPNMPGGYDA